MASFEIRRHHNMAKGDLKLLAEKLTGKLRQRYGIEPRWQGDAVSMEGPGVKGRLTLGDEEVVVNVSLGVFAAALQGRIRTEVERYLDETLS